MSERSIEDSGDSEEGLEWVEDVEGDGVDIVDEPAALPGAVATVWSDIVMVAHRRLREGRAGGNRAPA